MMKIAFPTQESLGIESPVYNHFGSARYFVIVNSETGEQETVDNQDLNHEHGKCQPMLALGRKTVDAVVVGGIGRGALQKLHDKGVKTYRAVEGTVAENLKLITAGKLPEFNMDQTCSGHGKIGECIH